MGTMSEISLDNRRKTAMKRRQPRRSDTADESRPSIDSKQVLNDKLARAPMTRKCESQQHGSGVIPKARIKTIKMTLVIVAAYILCWSPFCIINLCSVFRLMKEDSNITIAIKTLTQSLAHLNSAVNPIIFWIFSSKRNITPRSFSSENRNLSRRSSVPSASSLWITMKKVLCCQYEFNLKGKSVRSDSRMFESTGTSAMATSVRDRLGSLNRSSIEYQSALVLTHQATHPVKPDSTIDITPGANE